MSGVPGELVAEIPVAAPVQTVAPDLAPVAAEAPINPVATVTVADAPVVAPEAVPNAEGAAPVAQPDAPAGDAPKLEEKPADAATAVKPSLLSEADADAPKPGETKPADGATAAEAITEAAALTYETLKLPEGITAAPEQMKGYTDLLSEHGVSPEVGQKFLDLHGAQMQAFVEQAGAEQHRVWNETRAGWRKDVMADEQIGGAGHQTAMQAIARMRDAFASDAKAGTPKYVRDMAEFDSFANSTGAGDHPALLRLLHNMARRYDEPVAPAITGSPTKANGQPPGQRGPKALYGNSNRAN